MRFLASSKGNAKCGASASSKFPRSFCLSRVRVKFKLLIAAIRNVKNFAIYCALRFKSSFRITDSAISFIDLRICWLCRCMVR